MRKLLLPMNKANLAFILFSFCILSLLFNPAAAHAAFQWPWEQAAAQDQAGNSDITTSQTAQSKVSAADLASRVEPRLSSAATSQASVLVPQNTVLANKLEDGSQIKRSSAEQEEQPGQFAAQKMPTSFTVKAPARNQNYEEAVKMQAKLNDLVRLTAEMELVNRSKIGAVQGMVEKARVNQDTLARLSSPVDVASKISKVDADQILLNKKIRAMREEVEKQMALQKDNEPR